MVFNIVNMQCLFYSISGFIHRTYKLYWQAWKLATSSQLVSVYKCIVCTWQCEPLPVSLEKWESLKLRGNNNCLELGSTSIWHVNHFLLKESEKCQISRHTNTMLLTTDLFIFDIFLHLTPNPHWWPKRPQRERERYWILYFEILYKLTMQKETSFKIYYLPFYMLFIHKCCSLI